MKFGVEAFVVATGIAGISETGDGLVSETGASDKSGVYGNSTRGGYGVTGRVVGGGGYGVGSVVGVQGESTTGWAGFFQGDVTSWGTLSKNAGALKIAQPLDPAKKDLYHSLVESPDMKNLYDGVVTLDAKDEAVVELPDWFGR